MAGWYSSDKEELRKTIEGFLAKNPGIKPLKIHGIIVPHAGYVYSGAIAGKAYSLLKNAREKKVIILGPSHYTPLEGIATHYKQEWITPLGSIKVELSNYNKLDMKREHSIDNQIPFLQKLGFESILPLMIGKISMKEAENIAEELSSHEGVFVISSDLSHFLNYELANKTDKETLDIILNLDIKNADKIDACGIYPLYVVMQLCILKGWKPKLIEYKNSGDITGDKESVVGYAAIVF